MPDDDNVQALFAESLMDLSPWAYWEADAKTPKDWIVGERPASTRMNSSARIGNEAQGYCVPPHVSGNEETCDIAVVGLDCRFPKADDPAGSNLQVDEQQSPSRVLPSSQSSVASRMCAASLARKPRTSRKTRTAR